MTEFLNAKRTRAILAAAILSLALLTSFTLPPMLSAAAQASEASETADRVAKNKEYLTKARAIFEEQKSETDQAEIEKHEKEIRALEQLNMKLYEMDAELMARLQAVEAQLVERYLDVNSTSYVGDNPVEIIFTDLLRRTVVVIVDPEKLAETGPVQIEDQVNGVPVTVVETAVEDTSCVNNSRTEECRPLIGGSSIREQSKIGTSPFDTLGYKATVNGVTGFALAGHSAVADNKYIIQPYDENKVVGQVEEHCDNWPVCDFAWADASTGISVSDDICKGSSSSCLQGYDISSKTSDANQLVGTFVKKSGAKTGVTLGEVSHNGGPTVPYNHAQIYSEGGDSGSSIFYESGGNANLYGLMTNKFFYQGEWHVTYWPQDYIQTKIGAVASTS